MSELFRTIAAEQLVAWIFSELDHRDAILGIARQHFFVPSPGAPYRTSAFGQPLETPFGPAAGPHTQMAQNIVAAWLCGARYIELKTVQTLDELDVSKPCIDMQDEGYNVEWSQELKVYESFDEYLRAWILIHALHRKLGFPGDSPGIVFNMSVGYDLAGIQKPNMQWFLDQMADCSDYKHRLIDEVARFYPPIRDIEIPDLISNNVTLSTMHGCPPEEVEDICAYLLGKRGLHTLVKLNPTLIGPERLRAILHDDLGYADVIVPDLAFDHDLKFADAVPMLSRLRDIAAGQGLEFGVKLTNTLEVENTRAVFDASEKMSYLSGRPLHAISVSLAHEIRNAIGSDLVMSFSAGANCFNATSLLAAGMQTVTACSDLLKTGGYLRLLDYIESLDVALTSAGVDSIDKYILATAGGGDIANAARDNLRRYAQLARNDAAYRKGPAQASHTKTQRALGLFDCIAAPCVDECPLHQKVPQYMSAVRNGQYDEARKIIDADNPLPCVLGRICDHQCEQVCVRYQLDEPVAIRDIKRFVTDRAPAANIPASTPSTSRRVAILGAGPGGMAAGLELARGGCSVEIFEQQAYAGGMVGGVVPEYRLPQAVFDRDFRALTDLGVKIHYQRRAGSDITLSALREDGFDAVVIAVGAQLGRRLGLDGEDSDGVVDALYFLRRSREKSPVDIGRRVGVIGAGDTAMDCARTASRYPGTEVTLVYRRSIDQMPADPEEIEQLLEEGVNVVELAKPVQVIAEDGKLRGLRCRRTTYSGDRDASGRKIPHEVPESDFEIPFDTLILAISQRALLDFFDDEPVAVNKDGYIETDPDTFETSVPCIYAGGDVANNGPASIVKAAAAGKAIANQILGRAAAANHETKTALPDLIPLLRRRSHREHRVRAETTPVAARDRNTEVMLTYSERQARDEAARCLDCDVYCSICVGVCPNLALQTYRSEEPGKQAYQVAVIADLCNECGNCTTFCPTSGHPYRDKPRLYLRRADFEEQQDNAFMIFRDGGRWAIDARWDGATQHIELRGKHDSRPNTLAMLALLKGVASSLSHAPIAHASPVGCRVTHPGYEE